MGRREGKRNREKGQRRGRGRRRADERLNYYIFPILPAFSYKKILLIINRTKTLLCCSIIKGTIYRVKLNDFLNFFILEFFCKWIY
jgi:hypothetical protein